MRATVIPRSIVVRFTPTELAWCASVAQLRQGIKDRHGMRTDRFSDDVGSNTHIDPVRAELAVIKALGYGAVDTTVSARGNRAGNLILSDDLRGHARYRAHRGWDMALKSDRMAHFYGQVAFLVWPEYNATSSSMEVMGWISRDEFEAEARLTSYRTGKPVLFVPVAALHPMSQRPTATYMKTTQESLL